MTQKELEQKVIDAEGRVAKREAVLKKHNSQLTKMIEKGADRFDISIKREDIKSATSKLAEARETLANWKDKLNTRITRDAYIEANTPEILKDFLENWKQHAIGYYREKRIRFIEYREGLKAKERAARLEALQTLPSLEKYRELYKGRELTDYDLANLWPRRDVDAFLSERGLEYRQIQKKLREAGDQITLKLLEIHNEDEREAWLEKTMEEEKRAKLLDLIGRIMSTVGTITDAAALYIGPEGDINGIIVGTEGKAKIQTIGAGGYNIQCFHFRTLIHEIMYNHTGLQGRLTADPELRYTQQGTAITSFTLASDTGRKTKDGKKITNFIECVAWRAQAEFVCKYLSKGRLVLVEGELTSRSYEDKDGNRRKAVEITVDSVHFCDSKKDGGQSSGSDFADPGYSEGSGDFTEIEDNGDLPF